VQCRVNAGLRLMCMTRMNTFTEDEVVTVTPLRTSRWSVTWSPT